MNGRSPPVSLLEDKGIVSFFCLISLTPQTLPWTWCVLRNIDCGPQIRKKKNALYLFRQEVGGNSSLHESDRQIRGYVRHWREPVIWDSNPGRERLQPHPCRLQVQILEVWVLFFHLDDLDCACWENQGDHCPVLAVALEGNMSSTSTLCALTCT